MKFKATTESIAKFRRKQIRTRLYESGFITLYEVKEMFMEKTNESDQDYGWPKVIALENKIRVRQTKNGWFLYLPEPSKMTCNGENMNMNMVKQLEVNENGFKIEYSNLVEMFEENNKKTDAYMEKEIEAINGVTRALVNMNFDIYTRLAKLVDMIGANNEYFYRQCTVKAKKSGLKEERQDRKAIFHRWADVTVNVHQVVGIVEFSDGHVEQVKPDRIVFDEWQEEEE